MAKTNTYLHGYSAQYVGHHELRTAESDAAYLLPTLQSMEKTNPQIQLLDIGCGSGTISTSLAKYIPQGQVTAVDLSQQILDRAADFAKQAGVSNIRFQTADVNSLPFPDASFDIAHTSQMLCYQADPVVGLKEILRVTKPGGVAAIRECDMRMWSFHPKLPLLDKFLEIQLATHEAAGCSNFAGPQLLSWALQAGVPRENVVMTHGVWSYSQPFERRAWGHSWAQRMRAGGLGEKAMSMGLATQEECEEMAKAWEDWAAREDASFGALHGELLIKK